ncbi:PAS domain S-box protein, partial [Candidatus Woesearchaeota archaeon]|nr:PAS domain S-box protein [Candidatus Woesearchaeota archaeon]
MREEPEIVKTLRQEEMLRVSPLTSVEKVELINKKEDKKEADLIKFLRVIEQSQTSVIITDAKGNIEYINPRFEEVSGYSKYELIGRNNSVLNSGKTSKKTYENLWEQISSGKTWKGDLLNKKKNGELYWENVIITPIKNPEGKITNFVASKEDITERKKTEEEMKVKDHAIRSSINAIIIANSVGNITYVNPSFLKLWGYIDQKEIIGKPIVKFWQMKGQYMKVMDAMVNKGGWVGELIAERKNGSTFPVQLSANLIKDENGDIKYMMASFVDITKQKEAEEEILENQKRIEEKNIKLRKLDELKSTFLNVTSHELRTPMASIKGYVQMIIKQALGETSKEQNKALNVVLRNVERLDHLIQDILDISRLESGTMKFVAEEVDISNMIKEIDQTM